jgi:tetratricopeptide (TPR) repeat protein
VPGLFIGRRRELDTARHALTGAAAGLGSVLVLAGPAGIGKSRLAQEIIDLARARDFRVVWGAAWPDGGAAPYWPWQPVLDALAPGASDALDTSPGSAETERFDRFRAVGDTLAKEATNQPLVIAIDDVHALDADGLLLTRFVARSAITLPLLLLLTQRTLADAPESTASLLAEIGREGTVLPLDGLAADELTEFVAARGIDAHDALVDRVRELTDGVPFLVEQVLDHRLHDGPRALPQAARHVLDTSLEQLDATTRAVLEAAAVLGPATSRYEFAAVAAVDASAIDQARNAAAALGLVSSEGGATIEFSHDLAREAVLARAAPERLESLHRRCIDALANDEGSPERVGRRARHTLALASCSDADAREAIAVARHSAGVLTMHGSPETAVELLTEALAVQETIAPAETAPLLVELGDALLATGRLSAARDVFARGVAAAGAAADDLTYAEAAIGLGGVQVQEHRAGEDRRTYGDILRRAIDRIEHDSSPTAARLRASLGMRLATEEAVFVGDPAPGRDAVDAVRQSGTPRDLAAALSMLHALLLGPQFTDERAHVTAELLDLARTNGDELYTVIGLLWQAVDMLLVGRDADRALTELRARADALGMRAILYLTDAIGVMQLLRAGDLKQAEIASTSTLERGIDVGDPDSATYYGGHVLALSWFVGHATDLLDMAEELSSSTAMTDENPIFVAVVAALAAEIGDADRAERAISVLGRGHLGEIMPTSSWLLTMFVLVEAAVALDDASLASELYGILTPYAQLPVMASLGIACFGSAERPLGLAARVMGRVDDAVGHLERALASDLRLGNRPMIAITRADLAETLLMRGAPGDRITAGDLLEKAIDAAERMNLDGRLARFEQLRERAATATEPVTATCRRDGDVWELAAGDERARIAHSIGMTYLARLLEAPETDILAGQLAGIDIVSTKQDVLDETALRALRQRVSELEDELDAATLRGDDEKIARAQAELDAVIEHARASAGLGNRSRQFDDATERARTSVQKAIRRALSNIDHDAPELAAALRASVRTGYQCRYEPTAGAPRRWVVTTT